MDGDTRLVTPQMYEKWMPNKLQANDVLLTSEAPLGETAFLRDGGNYCLGQRLFALRADSSKVHPRFLYYLLRSPNTRHAIEARATGTTAQGIRQSELVKVEVELPPLPHQEAAAQLLGCLDDKIEVNRRMNETLEGIARAIFKSWFVDFDPVRAKMEGRDPYGIEAEVAALFPDSFEESELGLIPAGWEVKKLADLCTTQYGYTTSAVDEPVGPKFLRVKDINKLPWVVWASVPHCAINDEEMLKYALTRGDVVVARMADPGKVAIIEDHVNAVFASYLVRLKTRSLAWAYFVHGFLKSDLYAEYTEGAITGSVQKNMNARVIVDAQLIVPADAVVDAFLSAILPLREKLALNLRESAVLAELRDALLPKLVSGELQIKDVEKIAGAAL